MVNYKKLLKLLFLRIFQIDFDILATELLQQQTSYHIQMKKILLFFIVVLSAPFYTQAQNTVDKKEYSLADFRKKKTTKKDFDNFFGTNYKKVQNANNVLPKTTFLLGESIVFLVDEDYDKETEVLRYETEAVFNWCVAFGQKTSVPLPTCFM